jgi:hypothetical protein
MRKSNYPWKSLDLWGFQLLLISQQESSPQRTRSQGYTRLVTPIASSRSNAKIGWTQDLDRRSSPAWSAVPVRPEASLEKPAAEENTARFTCSDQLRFGAQRLSGPCAWNRGRWRLAAAERGTAPRTGWFKRALTYSGLTGIRSSRADAHLPGYGIGAKCRLSHIRVVRFTSPISHLSPGCWGLRGDATRGRI